MLSLAGPAAGGVLEGGEVVLDFGVVTDFGVLSEPG